MSDTNPLVNRFPWTGTVKVSGVTGSATGIASITGGTIYNTDITYGTISNVPIINSSLDGTPIGSIDPDIGVFTVLTVQGASTFGSASAARVTTAGGATATNGGAGVISTAGTDTNTHLLLTTKNASSVVESDRAQIRSTSSSLDTLVGLRSTYTKNWFHDNITYAGAMAERFTVTGALAGTITGSNFAVNSFTASSDNVDATTSGGLSYLYVGANVGGTNFVGNRTGITSKVTWSTTSPIQTSFRFMTGISGGAYISTQPSVNTAFGYGYDESDGYVFGGLLQARAQTGARFVKSLQGLELNVGNYETAVPVLDMGGIQAVMENADVGPWMRQANAYGFANQTAWTGQGWHIGFAFAQANGQFGLNRTYGTVLGGVDSQYGSAPACAFGADFALLNTSQGVLRGYLGNMLIDGSGNIGGQVVAGTTLQTRSSIVAKTAVVNTITVVDGSLCLSIPTLTVAAPPGSGTQATAAVNTMAAAYMRSLTGGTEYAVNDTVTLSGGTFTSAAVFTVSEAPGGVPTRLTIATPGSYTVLPAGPISTTTSGAGTGLTMEVWWTILTVTVTGAGTNYPQYPPPLVTAAYTLSGGDRSPLRRPMFQVAMTASAATLVLNAGDIDVTGIPTSSAGLPSGRVWANANVLTVVP